MSETLLDQLDRYGDDFVGATTPLDLDRIVDPARPTVLLSGRAARSRAFPSWAYAVVAAVVVLVAGAGVAWLRGAATDIDSVFGNPHQLAGVLNGE